MKKISLTQLAELAKQQAFEGITPDSFILFCPNGNILTCDWLDPYFGMFIPKGEKGFLMVNQIEFAFTECCIPLPKEEKS